MRDKQDLWTALLVTASLAASAQVMGASFTPLGYLAGGGTGSYGAAVSADGSVVAGSSDSTA